jgi:hypothetical protein
MAIGAIFNLDMRQWDAINAFVNSVLDEEVYVCMPDGFEEAGCCWLLLKALYGLRRGVYKDAWTEGDARFREMIFLFS